MFHTRPLYPTRIRGVHPVSHRWRLAAPAITAVCCRRPELMRLIRDEQRPDSLACYGSRWAHSPHQVARAAAGAVFVSAYAPSPVCVPCHVALISGNSPSTKRVFLNPARLQPGAKSFLGWRTGSPYTSQPGTSAGD